MTEIQNNPIFDGMNESQIEAVLHTEGPTLILAGAGSGKTRVLTCRIAHLVKDLHVRPRNILALTFTNKAAKEMRDRAVKMADGVSLNELWALTFHSMCARILRVEHEYVGLRGDFVIYDTEDRKAVLEPILDEVDKNHDRFKDTVTELERIKREGYFPKEYADVLVTHPYDDEIRRLSTIYTAYQAALERSNALDFADLILYTEKLFKGDPDVLNKYANRFHYIMVDEYQDTDPQQFRLVRMLSSVHGNLMVVGDDDQSIYSFRGADIRNILDFEKSFPGTYVVKLERNYRSTANIVGAANGLIAHNKARKDKTAYTRQDPGSMVIRCDLDSASEEAAYIADEMLRLHQDGGYSYGDMAVLYRTKQQSGVLEPALVARNIPHIVRGGMSFFSRAVIKDLVGYMRVAYNPHDNVALMRVINTPRRGIGDTTLHQIEYQAMVNKVSIWTVLCDQEKYGCPVLKKKIQAGLDEFCRLVTMLNGMFQSHVLSEILDKILDETKYMDALENGKVGSKGKPDSGDDTGSDADYVEELVRYMYRLDDENTDREPGEVFAEFLDLLALMSASEKEKKKGDFHDCAVLSTIHASKGLEFPVVFVAGLVDTVLPHTAYEGEDPEHIEEERRLFYVAMTRAEKLLYITMFKGRMVTHKNPDGSTFKSWGQTDPSRFLQELPGRMVYMDVPAVRQTMPRGGHRRYGSY